MSYQDASTANNEQIKSPLERVKNSPLSNLNPPLSSAVKPLSPTLPTFNPACPLSSSSYQRLRKDLARAINYVCERDLTSIDRVCAIMIDELHNLQSVGREYLIDMAEGD